MAAVDLGLGDLDNIGGAIMKSSGGLYVAVFRDNSTYIRAYTISGGTPTLIGSAQTGTVIHGAGTPNRVHAAIDSNNVIHVVVVGVSTTTRDVAYNTISNVDSSPAWGTWEEAAGFAELSALRWGVNISVDSNDKPHVIYLNYVKEKGVIYSRVTYVEKTGASWSSPEEISDVINNHYDHPHIAIKASDNAEAIYGNFNTGDLTYKTRTSGTWGSASTVDYTTDPWIANSVITVTTGGTVYRYWSGDDTALDRITENSVYVGYVHDGAQWWLGATLINDSDRYIVYIEDVTRDVALLKNDGGGWTSVGTLQTGTYDGATPGWQYLNNHADPDEIIYLFNDSTHVWFDVYPLAAVTRRVFITHM